MTKNIKGCDSEIIIHEPYVDKVCKISDDTDNEPFSIYISELCFPKILQNCDEFPHIVRTFQTDDKCTIRMNYLGGRTIYATKCY